MCSVFCHKLPFALKLVVNVIVRAAFIYSFWKVLRWLRKLLSTTEVFRWHFLLLPVKTMLILLDQYWLWHLCDPHRHFPHMCWKSVPTTHDGPVILCNVVNYRCSAGDVTILQKQPIIKAIRFYFEKVVIPLSIVILQMHILFNLNSPTVTTNSVYYDTFLAFSKIFYLFFVKACSNKRWKITLYVL